MDTEDMIVLKAIIPLLTFLGIAKFAYSPTDETLRMIGMVALFFRSCCIAGNYRKLL